MGKNFKNCKFIGIERAPLSTLKPPLARLLEQHLCTEKMELLSSAFGLIYRFNAVIILFRQQKLEKN